MFDIRLASVNAISERKLDHYGHQNENSKKSPEKSRQNPAQRLEAEKAREYEIGDRRYQKRAAVGRLLLLGADDAAASG
jgi:hypothetical protein